MIPVFDLPIPFDTLVGASDNCLWGYAPGFVNVELEKQIPGKAVFRLRQSDLGDLGTVEITKESAGMSEVLFVDGPAPTEEEAIAYALTRKRSEFSDEWAQVLQSFLEQSREQARQESKPFHLFHGLPGDELRAKSIEFLKQKRRAVGFLKDAREKHQWSVMQTYFARLSDEPIWLKRPAWLPNVRLVEQYVGAPAAASGEEQSETSRAADGQIEQAKSENDFNGQHLTTQWPVIVVAIVLFVLGVLITLVANVASTTLPKEWNPYLWLSWPLLVILISISAVLVIWQVRKTGLHNT